MKVTNKGDVVSVDSRNIRVIVYPETNGVKVVVAPYVFGSVGKVAFEQLFNYGDFFQYAGTVTEDIIVLVIDHINRGHDGDRGDANESELWYIYRTLKKTGHLDHWEEAKKYLERFCPDYSMASHMIGRIEGQK